MRFLARADFFARSLAISGLALAAAACTTDDGSNTLSNLFFFNKTEAPEVSKPATEAIYCPSVDVIEGGAHTMVGGGQATISDLARECHVREDGTVLVKVGVAGRVIATGAAGRYSVPVTFRVKAGDKIFAQRAQTVAATRVSDGPSAEFAAVQEGLVVPAANVQNFDIEVGLGRGGRARAPAPAADAGGDGW